MYKNSNVPFHIHSVKTPKCSYFPQGACIEHILVYKTQMDYQASIRCRLPEDDLKKFETCWSLSGLYVKVYILIPVLLLVLSVKLFIKARMWILLILWNFSVLMKVLIVLLVAQWMIHIGLLKFLRYFEAVFLFLGNKFCSFWAARVD